MHSSGCIFGNTQIQQCIFPWLQIRECMFENAHSAMTVHAAPRRSKQGQPASGAELQWHQNMSDVKCIMYSSRTSAVVGSKRRRGLGTRLRYHGKLVDLWLGISGRQLTSAEVCGHDCVTIESLWLGGNLPAKGTRLHFFLIASL